ncbi:MAG: hypothetical protein AAF108_08065 [Planctomycetota bacterium]
MSTYQGKAVHLVGHCGPDSFMLKNALERALPGATVSMVNEESVLQDAMGGSSLLLVNRVLDGAFPTESGVELIRTLAAADKAPPAMLISNFADAQEEAESAGAVPGFGKNDTGSPEAAEKIVAAVGGADA